MNIDNVTVSIIIPAYNVGDYIHRGIESVLNQTYKKIELIVVNDGSTDNTLSNIRKYSSDERLICITQDNQGVSSARNNGLRKCTGEYVLFLDGDDWLEKNTVETLLLFVKDGGNKYMPSVSRFFSVIDNDTIFDNPITTGMKKNIVVSYNKAVMDIGVGKYALQSSCYKLYRTDIIRKYNLFFNEKIYHGEDGLFVFKYLTYMDGIVYKDVPLWHILERNNSATVIYDDKMYTAISAVEEMIKHVKNGEIIIHLEKYLVQRAISVLGMAVLDNKNHDEMIKRIKYKINQYSVQYYKHSSLKEKFRLSIYLHCPVCMLKKILVMKNYCK